MVDYLAYSDTLLTPSTSTSPAQRKAAPDTHGEGQARTVGRATPHRLRFHQRPRPVPRPAPRPRSHA